MTLQIIGIILGFAVLIGFTFKAWSVYLASFLGAVVVILFAGLPLTETVTSVYFGSIGAIFTSLFPLFIFGSVMANLYAVSGAAVSISTAVCNLIMKDDMPEDRRRILGVIVVILASALICYGGINAAIVIITIYPIGLSVFQRCGIPKRFIPGVILGGCCTFALTGPGSPQTPNVIPMTILGTSSTSGLVPGIIAMIVELIVMVLVLNVMIRRACSKGEVFRMGPFDHLPREDKEEPNALISLIPLAVLFVLFNVVHLPIVFAMFAAAFCSAVLFFRYIPRGKFRRTINEGFVASLTPVGSIGAVFAFASVVQKTDAFSKIVEMLLGMEIHPILFCIIAIAFLCMLTGGSATGQQIVLPIIMPVIQSSGLISLAAMHRIGSFAATTLDSLPHSGTILMTTSHADTPMREAYPAIFVTTTLATVTGTIVVALLLWLFPGLA